MHEYEASCSLNAIFSNFDWFCPFIFAYLKNLEKKLINIIEIQIKSETILRNHSKNETLSDD